MVTVEVKDGASYRILDRRSGGDLQAACCLTLSQSHTVRSEAVSPRVSELRHLTHRRRSSRIGRFRYIY